MLSERSAQAGVHPDQALAPGAAMAGKRKQVWTSSPLALSKTASNLLLLWGIPLAVLLGHFLLQGNLLKIS